LPGTGAMSEPFDNRSFIWIIDDADKIVHVNDDWLAFARENGAPQLSASVVLEAPIWRFIQGQETVYLYQQIFGRLRAGKSPIKFPFRCDSPDCRRFMEMKLSLLSGTAIQFLARLLRQEFRQPLDLLNPSGDRSEEFLKICSWCKKIYIPDHGWGEVEAAIGPLDLFGRHPMPRMTHTICESCYDVIRQELNQESGAEMTSN
jgi:hypothetical protein